MEFLEDACFNGCSRDRSCPARLAFSFYPCEFADCLPLRWQIRHAPELSDELLEAFWRNRAESLQFGNDPGSTTLHIGYGLGKARDFCARLSSLSRTLIEFDHRACFGGLHSNPMRQRVEIDRLLRHVGEAFSQPLNTDNRCRKRGTDSAESGREFEQAFGAFADALDQRLHR